MPEGEFLTVVGPSGCGKSTLLDLLSGLTQPSSGQILLDRRPITGPGLDRGVVFQQYALLPWRTVGYLLLPLATSAPVLGVVALVLGVGNGLSNGIIMTLGADVAPAATWAAFFVAWRLMHDGGMFVGPLAVAGLAVVAPLSVAAVVVGGASFLGAAVMWRCIQIYITWPLVAGAASPARSAPSETPEALSKSRTLTAVEVSVTTEAIR